MISKSFKVSCIVICKLLLRLLQPLSTPLAAKCIPNASTAKSINSQLHPPTQECYTAKTFSRPVSPPLFELAEF
ncbi:uncharacterized protein B0H64DRAFT_407770 [Chaetomium fimeti]|uniref:Secreted protein n=1 Tax=Chaetomium fimeti TaxID=1854472 RepID=A0AAE0H850_9PEZI|nr:hypothetical protein B0H64DRAFT_407770 [Chaetomium fimeti]